MSRQVSTWPEYVDIAYRALGYEEYHLQLRVFLGRWGSIDLETFERVLHEGQCEERVLAIFALGSARISVARELLLPFPQSTEPRERWASALCLGQMREEQALAPLCELLTANFPPKEQPESQAVGRWFYNNCRLKAILILAEWTRPEVVPRLLTALQAYWEMEQAIIAHSHLGIGSRYWRWCQSRVAYALGWLGAFDLPRNMQVGERRLSAWNVYLALGHLHAHVGIPDIFTKLGTLLRQSRGFHDLVCHVLEVQLGLSQEEQERCLNACSTEHW